MVYGNLFKKGIRIHPEASLTNSITVLNKSKFFIFILFVIILSITWMIFFHNPYKRGNIQPTIQEINQNFAQFVQILSSDNIDDLQRRKNHKILGKVENTIKYFESIALSAEKLFLLSRSSGSISYSLQEEDILQVAYCIQNYKKPLG